MLWRPESEFRLFFWFSATQLALVCLASDTGDISWSVLHERAFGMEVARGNSNVHSRSSRTMMMMMMMMNPTQPMDWLNQWPCLLQRQKLVQFKTTAGDVPRSKPRTTVSALGQWDETYAGRVDTPCTKDSSSLGARRRLGQDITNTTQQGVSPWRRCSNAAAVATIGRPPL